MAFSNQFLSSATKPSRTGVHMGLFDFFGPKKSATASHILIKGNNGAKTLTALKASLSKEKNIPEAFATAAATYSSCPSANKGGALGTFKQGQMVPAFDKVVFNDEVGVIHGPITTPFGSHLILIERRS
jgi:peptidyl-prolyl cis-trans isomerase C